MTSSDELFLLIKSLGKQEKRYFKLFSSQHTIGDENNYIKLFDAIEAQKNYDEKAIISKLKDKGFIKHLSSMKVYLYNLILKSLRNYNSKSTISDEISGAYKNSEILFNRGFYKQGMKVLLKAKKLAQTEQRFNFLPDILKLERKFSLALKKNQSVFFLDEQMEETKRTYSFLEAELKYEYLNLQLWNLFQRYGYIRNEKDAEHYRKFLADPLLTNEKNATTYQSKFYLYSILGLTYSALGELENSRTYYKKSIDLMRAHPNSIKDNASGYVLACGNLLNSHLRLDDSKAHYEELKKLKGLNKEYKNSLNINAQCRSFEITAIHELLHIYNAGDFHETDKVIPKIHEEIEKWGERLIQDPVNTIYYYCAYIYLCSGNPKKGLFYLNQILSLPENKIREDLLGSAKLLSLFIYIEIGDLDLLYYANKSVYRFFNNKDKLLPFEKVILDFFRKRSSSKSSSNETVFDLENLRDAMIKVHAKEEGNYMSEYLDIISWLTAKIENRPISEILKRKK